MIATDDSLVDGHLPSHWKAGPRTDRLTSAPVLCAYEQDTGETVDNCRYVGGVPVMLTTSRATYLLYEAKTSEPVTRFTVDGDSGCPPEIRYYEGEKPPVTIAQDIDYAEVNAKLRPYVEGRAR
ncbi:hypothetical protein [Streptomyces sp. NPDC014676]|uniref:hypothetical protein n=1 Tax=Streptomyces sp. NPDC014676 TaxID=3364879 RepID=UPI0037019B68